MTDTHIDDTSVHPLEFEGLRAELEAATTMALRARGTVRELTILLAEKESELFCLQIKGEKELDEGQEKLRIATQKTRRLEETLKRRCEEIKEWKKREKALKEGRIETQGDRIIALLRAKNLILHNTCIEQSHINAVLNDGEDPHHILIMRIADNAKLEYTEVKEYLKGNLPLSHMMKPLVKDGKTPGDRILTLVDHLGINLRTGNVAIAHVEDVLHKGEDPNPALEIAISDLTGIEFAALHEYLRGRMPLKVLLNAYTPTSSTVS